MGVAESADDNRSHVYKKVLQLHVVEYAYSIEVLRVCVYVHAYVRVCMCLCYFVVDCS